MIRHVCFFGLVILLLSACRPPIQSKPEASEVKVSNLTEISASPAHPGPVEATNTLESVKPVDASSATASPAAQEPLIVILVSTSTVTQTVAVEPTQTPSSIAPPASPTSVDTAYPGPFQNLAATSDPEAYPGPNQEPNPETYPGPESTGSTPYPGESSGIFGAGGQSNPTALPTQVLATPSPGASPTPFQLPAGTPTSASVSGVFSPLLLPQAGPNPILTIWHPLEYPKLAALEDIIRAFQGTFPQVGIDLHYIPLDDLRNSYAAAVYQDRGPDLLLGPSEWSAELFDQGLVADLRSYFPETFWQAIAPVALETGQHRQAQVSLPVTMSGVVLYRNAKIIPQASANFETMVDAARKATRVGIVGAYIELDPLYSMAHLEGLGMQWQDGTGKPVFNRQDYAAGRAWLALLQDFDRLGAIDLNTSRDLNLFRQGKIGLMIDGTWNMEELALALGRQDLKLDSWPEYGAGRLSGYVFSQGFYLNSDTAGRADARLMAALQFTGAALLPQSQLRLADENTYLPVLQDLQNLDLLKVQAVHALEGGTAFPPVWQGQPFEVYRMALQTAIRQAMGLAQGGSTSAIAALQNAYQAISGWFTSQDNTP
jgi:maltose-binding protein MalE